MRSADRVRIVIGGVLALPVLTALANLLGRTPYDEGYPFAEMFTGAVVTRDLLDGAALADWILPEATYLVPDWPIWFVLEGLDISPFTSVWLFGVIQVGLFAVLWLTLARRLPGGLTRAGVVGAPLLVWYLAMNGAQPVSFALVSFWRFGTMLLTLAGLILTLALRRTRSATHRIALGIALATLIGVAHVSDEAIGAWFTVPTVLALLLTRRRLDHSRAMLTTWLAGVAAGHLAGLLIEPHVGRRLAAYQAWITPTAIPDRFREFFRVQNLTFGDAPVMTALVVAGLALAVHRLATDRTGPVERLLVVYLLISGVVVSVAQMMLGGPSPLGDRMIIHVVVFSLLYVGYLGTEYLATHLEPTARMVTSIVVVVAVIGVISPRPDLGTGMELELGYARCVRDALAAHRGEVGLASYASQNAVLFFTDLDLRIENASDLDPTSIDITSWPQNSTWTTAGDPAFVIADNWSYRDDPVPTLTRTPVVATYGPPSSEVHCTRWLVLLYD